MVVRVSLWLDLRGRVEHAAGQLGVAADQLFAELDHLDMVERLGQQVFGGTNNPDMRGALDLLPQARTTARDAYLEYTQAARRCRAYLAAVDPDGAGGSVGGLPEPVECGPVRGGWQERGGPDVEPARQPVTDVSRSRTAVYTELGPDGLTELNNLDDGIVAMRGDLLAGAGHATRRHGPTVTKAHLDARAVRQIDPITATTTDWETGELHRAGRHATAFTSREALVFAEATVWNSPERAVACAHADTMRVGSRDWKWAQIEIPANPQGTRATAFTDDATVKVVYRREPGSHGWLPYTCYVQP